MKSVFADTFYYIALLDAKDSAHERAVRATRELNSATVTTAWVLLELANALSASRHRAVFARFLDHLRANPDVIIYEAEKELFDRGVEIYRDREDQQWSLTDCISFVVMQREDLREALTGDHNFEQAGFRALLR
jgi:predicted nucleic acid-binding protein